MLNPPSRQLFSVWIQPAFHHCFHKRAITLHRSAWYHTRCLFLFRCLKHLWTYEVIQSNSLFCLIPQGSLNRQRSSCHSPLEIPLTCLAAHPQSMSHVFTRRWNSQIFSPSHQNEVIRKMWIRTWSTSEKMCSVTQGCKLVSHKAISIRYLICITQVTLMAARITF